MPRRPVKASAKKTTPAPDVAVTAGPPITSVPPTKSDVKSVAKVAADGAPLVVPTHGRGALKQGGDHPRPGRPREETRQVVRELLEKQLLPRAAEVIGRSKKVSDHLAGIAAFSEIGFNEKIRLARAEGQAKAAVAAAAQSGSNASVQVHVSGGPTGVERGVGEVQSG